MSPKDIERDLCRHPRPVVLKQAYPNSDNIALPPFTSPPMPPVASLPALPASGYSDDEPPVTETDCIRDMRKYVAGLRDARAQADPDQQRPPPPDVACAICYEPLDIMGLAVPPAGPGDKPERARVLGCGHVVGADCLADYVYTQVVQFGFPAEIGCPTCKDPLACVSCGCLFDTVLLAAHAGDHPETTNMAVSAVAECADSDERIIKDILRGKTRNDACRRSYTVDCAPMTNQDPVPDRDVTILGRGWCVHCMARYHADKVTMKGLSVLTKSLGADPDKVWAAYKRLAVMQREMPGIDLYSEIPDILDTCPDMSPRDRLAARWLLGEQTELIGGLIEDLSRRYPYRKINMRATVNGWDAPFQAYVPRLDMLNYDQWGWVKEDEEGSDGGGSGSEWSSSRRGSWSGSLDDGFELGAPSSRPGSSSSSADFDSSGTSDTELSSSSRSSSWSSLSGGSRTSSSSGYESDSSGGSGPYRSSDSSSSGDSEAYSPSDAEWALPQGDETSSDEDRPRLVEGREVWW